jgi:hypothetical protein
MLYFLTANENHNKNFINSYSLHDWVKYIRQPE